MPATLRGIYHNLKESKYMVSNEEIMFFFSSKRYMEKFLEGYQEYREQFNRKIGKITNPHLLNMDSLSDISFYQLTEKRGFCCWLKGIKINEVDVHRYAIRKMTEKESPIWVQMDQPKVGDRIR